MLIIRKAALNDLNSITAIYNDAVLNTTATFDTKPRTIEEQTQWFKKHDSEHPIYVAEEEGEIIGWISLSKWSEREAYAATAEVSLYVKEGFRGKGVGTKLLIEVIKTAENLELHLLVARIAAGAPAPVNLYKSCGFEYIGIMKEAGMKFGKFIDVHLLQLVLGN